jgi:hypothetical protein
MIRVQVAALLLVWLGQVCQAQQKLKESPATNVNLTRFLPPTATLVMQLAVHFGDTTSSEMVLAYGSESRPTVTTGVRVVKDGAIVFEESAGVTNGAGASDAIKIEKVEARNDTEGVIVALKTSGAGTATEWHVLAMVGGKVSRLNPGRARTNILEQRGYQDWGYNDVTSNGEYIIETQPGYSRETARCCPDRPTIKMTFKFTGTSVLLDKVAELPFTATKW